MSSSAKVLIKLYDIELEGIWGRGDQIYPGLWLTNDREGFESLLTSILANGAGVLEFSQFISPCVVIYSKLEKTEVESPRDAIALLSSYLYLIQGFLDALWVIKDHAVNFELGFLEAQRDGEPPFINSNLIGDSKNLANGGIRLTRFAREEVRLARDLFSKNFSPSCRPEEFKNNNPYLNRDHANEIASKKDSKRSERFFFFIGAARGQSDIGLKLAMYCTALEVLFSTDSSELMHKVSERTACFLGETVEERTSLYQQVKKAYNARSKVIHGDTLSNQIKTEIAELTTNTDSILRRIARRLMENPKLRSVFEDKQNIDSFFLNLVFNGPAKGLPEKIGDDLLKPQAA